MTHQGGGPPDGRRRPPENEPPRDRGAVTHLAQVGSPLFGLSLAERVHDRLRGDRLSGALALELLAVDDLHVGSGSCEIYEDRHGPVLVRSTMVNARGGTGLSLVVPGSSLKGVVRTLTEAVAGGCGEIRGCGRCVTCGLFGHAGRESFAGRVGFGDAEPSGEAQPDLRRLPMPRKPQKAWGRRLYSQPEVSSPGDVPYEVIPKGTVLRGRLNLVNLREDELGLLLRAMGADGAFPLRVGGGKFGGLGRCAVRVVGARLRRGYRRPLPEVLDAAGAAGLVQRALQAYRPDARAVGVLETIKTAHSAGGRR